MDTRFIQSKRMKEKRMMMKEKFKMNKRTQNRDGIKGNEYNEQARTRREEISQSAGCRH